MLGKLSQREGIIMADTCPRCSRYDPRNVHNLAFCWECTYKRLSAVDRASEDDIEKLRVHNKKNRVRRTVR